MAEFAPPYFSQSSEKPSPDTSSALSNKIKQLLQFQRYAVQRSAFIGINRQEAAEMEARLSQIEELVDQLCRLE